jgi:hypothetical protein
MSVEREIQSEIRLEQLAVSIQREAVSVGVQEAQVSLSKRKPAHSAWELRTKKREGLVRLHRLEEDMPAGV